VREFESSYLDYLETNHKETLNQLAAGKYESKLTDVLEEVAAELIAGMS
jgi:F-type H+-transporting ATPase subunit alpha